MTHANTEILTQFEDLCAKRKEEILNAKDEIVITGTTYYVSTSGNDDNDGKTPETAWKTLEKVSNAELKEGDGVRFCRGNLFRGYFITKPGVTYAAYGEGEKPKFYGWIENLADPLPTAVLSFSRAANNTAASLSPLTKTVNLSAAMMNLAIL